MNQEKTNESESVVTNIIMSDEDKSKIRDMILFFKELLKTSKLIDNSNIFINSKDENIKSLLESENTRFLKEIHLTNDFKQKYKIDEINIYSLWKYLLLYLKDNDKKKILFLDLSTCFIGLIKTENSLDFNVEVDYLSFEKFQLESIFCFLVNLLDKINMLYESWKYSRKKFPNLSTKLNRGNYKDLQPKEVEYLTKGVKEYYFAGNFYNYFSKIDKNNFHKHYLSFIRNQYTHYSNIQCSLYKIEEFYYMLTHTLNTPFSETIFKKNTMKK